MGVRECGLHGGVWNGGMQNDDKEGGAGQARRKEGQQMS